jgi:hypothetical protein
VGNTTGPSGDINHIQPAGADPQGTWYRGADINDGWHTVLHSRLIHHS